MEGSPSSVKTGGNAALLNEGNMEVDSGQDDS